MDDMTMKMDAQYKELQSRSNHSNPDCNDDGTPMSREEKEKFMQTFRRIRFYNDYRDRDSNHDNWLLSGRNDYNRDNYRSNSDDKPYDIQRYEDEEKESTTKPKNQTLKPVKETSIPKPYKPKISYPQCLRKEKMEAQYDKFLDIIRAIRINVPLVDVLAAIPNYGKFLKELISNKHKLEQISSAFLSDESFAMIQNKVPPKLEDPESFLIPCTFSKTFSSLQRCPLVLNWEKCHFMVKEGIVLGYKVSGAGLEVDKAKIDVISKLPPPTNIKGLELKGYLINDGYANLVQHVGGYFNTAGVFLLGFHQHNKWSSIHHV
uniref:Reverse transcriptase domain-containing protein n=1 Tax=Tanacetum cinerariifolium TaxID=118510 RepID=A0A6L2M3X0_TANCI|nr:reverse transcriptase domain-containing protein [Tanacetum cinerariifolium]